MSMPEPAPPQRGTPAGATTEVPFAVDLPADSGPTAEAVHPSIEWFVQVRVMYKGFHSHVPELVGREIVVFNA
jgi:hypothetical protein